MKMVSTAELKTHANRLLKEVTSKKKPVVITRHGVPCAVITPFNAEDIEELVFEYSPEFVRMAKESAADMKAGRAVTMMAFATKHGLT